jgi:hypothetical protein
MMTSLVSGHPTVNGNHEPLRRYRDMVLDGLPVDAADNRDRDKLKPKKFATNYTTCGWGLGGKPSE